LCRKPGRQVTTDLESELKSPEQLITRPGVRYRPGVGALPPAFCRGIPG
jgi:hypothetical protein